eukprot:scaffold44511_cov168-Amphora_coffeaeformis.AAC.1
MSYAYLFKYIIIGDTVSIVPRCRVMPYGPPFTKKDANFSCNYQLERVMLEVFVVEDLVLSESRSFAKFAV